jgi:hypothetical protein
MGGGRMGGRHLKDDEVGPEADEALGGRGGVALLVWQIQRVLQSGGRRSTHHVRPLLGPDARAQTAHEAEHEENEAAVDDLCVRT